MKMDLDAPIAADFPSVTDSAARVTEIVEDYDSPSLSVVVPIYNEEDNLPELVRRLTQILGSMELSHEVIFVNDGSQDRSLSILKDLIAANSRLKLIDLSRNFGHQAALYAGLCRAAGSGVVLMDGDLQDPPEVIPRLVELWRGGIDVVYAVRQKRKENWLKRAAYASYYRLLRSISEVPIPVDSGDFSLIDRKVVKLICAMPERHRFLRGLRSWAGYKQTGFTYERDARYAGQTKYTLAKLFRLAFDGFVSYSYLPLRISFVLGAVISCSGFLLASIYFTQKLISENFIPQGFTTLAILVLFMGGVQLLSLGLLGEYVGRIYDEVKRRPDFVEREVVGFEG